MLKHYFQLFRISNIFTVPPDILAGYFITIAAKSGVANYSDLLILVFSSIFLYAGGLATNDLFDLNIDKKERPNRPLPSGNIKKSTTILLSALFLGSGLLLASFLGITSTIVSFLLVVMILSYNYKLKNGVARPFLMGAIRGLNVIYGSSFNNSFFGNRYFLLENPGGDYTFLVILVIAAFAVFVHIFTLTFISARETIEELNKSKKPLNLKSVYITYLSVLVLTLGLGTFFLYNKALFFSFFTVFLVAVSFIFYKKMGEQKARPQDMQFIVKNMIVLLILLDASFVAGSAGLYIGVMTASFILPCIVVGKRIQMT